MRRRSRTSRWTFVHLVALFSLITTVAFAQEIQYLAISGDGTASLATDKAAKLAIIVDGGRQGSQGIAAAKANGMHVLDFLRHQGIETLAIACSHPHADHMGGLVNLITDERIKNFRLILIASGFEEISGRESLARIYEKHWGKRAIESSAFNRNAFATNDFLSGALRVSNYEYNPSQVGKDEHDAAMIVQYDVGSMEASTRVVDFDDASTTLVDNWAASSDARVNVLVLPHHGSRNNKITTILENRERYGLRDVVITVNERNRFRHPAPEILKTLIETLGVDHVFVTGSELGDNIRIDSSGQIKPPIRASNAKKVAGLVAARIAQTESALRQLLDEAQPSQNSVAPSQSLQDQFAGLLASGRLSERAQRRGDALVRDLVNLASVSDAVGTEPDVGTRAFASLVSHGASSSDASSRDTGFGMPPAPEDGASAPSLPSTGPRPSGPHGGGYGTYFETLTSSTMASGGGNSGGTVGGGGGSLFQAMVDAPWPIWGGVVVGNEVIGPGVTSMEIVEIGSEIDETVPDENPSYALRFLLANQGTADYVDLTALELWAAYNFVQPTAALIETLDGEFLPGNAVGLVGKTGDGPEGGWTFSIHPAIANSSIGRDAMRLDMFLVTAKELESAESPYLPGYLEALQLRSLQWNTYQWYDEKSDVIIDGPRVSVVARDGPRDCLMRVRLVLSASLPWLDESDLGGSIKREVRKRVAIGQEVEAAQKEVLQEAFPQDRSLNNSISPVCTGFDALHSIDRFAKLVAVLNWYRIKSGNQLPPLPGSLNFPSAMEIAPSLEFVDVLGIELELSRVEIAILVAVSLGVLVLVVGVSYLIVRLIRRLVSGRRAVRTGI